MSILREIKETKRLLADVDRLTKQGSGASVAGEFFVKNSEGSALPKFSVVELTFGLVDSSTHGGNWMSSLPVVSARKPQSGAVNLAVLTETIGAGKVGRAQRSGLLKAKVNITSKSHKYANVSHGSTVLVSGDGGQFFLMNCTDSTGEQYAYVALASGGEGGGGAEAKLYVEIIDGLMYETEHSLGNSTYLCRLTSDDTDSWQEDGGSEAGGDYAVNAVVIGSNNRKYICIVSAGSGKQDPTIDDGEIWQIVEDEVAVRIWDRGLAETDFREFLPYLKVGQVYPVRLFQGEFYFELTFIYIGTPGKSNFYVDPNTGQTYVAIGDTFS